MVFHNRPPANVWILIWLYSIWLQQGLSQMTTAIPSLSTPVVRPLFINHNSQICSTWGNFHYRNFDGDVFFFPGSCNYIFSSHCKSNYEDFNIEIHQTVENNERTFSQITMKSDGVVLEMGNNSISIDGNLVEKLPLDNPKLHMEMCGIYMKVKTKNGVTLMWNGKDSIQLILDTKYANQTCGLCGDFDGISGFTEFFYNGMKLNPVQFGNLQKLNNPTEDCNDPDLSTEDICPEEVEICESILKSTAFSSCNTLVQVDAYVQACAHDLCHCTNETRSFYMCSTFAEYSRQCAHSGGTPGNWRTSEMCPQQCPSSMEYQECGCPCPDTCTNSERALLCEDHCQDGCFCPAGTVLDDVYHSGCIRQEECFCIYNGETYNPGSSFSTLSRTCTCVKGKWNCQEIPCSKTCSFEGGAHITTFDESYYTIHGECSYVLAKLPNHDNFTMMVNVHNCGLTKSSSCLKSMMISLNGGQTTVDVKSSGSILYNSIPTQLPLLSGNINIFKPSSFFIIMSTRSGIQMQVQLQPTMQVYATLDPSYQGHTSGLCGNFNNIQSDDFKATSGIIEGTAAAFANTWKTQSICPDVQNLFEDPCSLSVENEKYAQHWCGLLTDPKGPFSLCHSQVNPSVYHTRCLSDTCSCKDCEDCMCAALSSYVHACSRKGVTLTGWRKNVCGKFTETCGESQTYSYSVTQCQPTCRARAETDSTCGIDFVPVDGCVCKEGTYMDETGACVLPTECPCYYHGISLMSGELIKDNDIFCICNEGQLNCMEKKFKKPVCSPPMIYFDCTNATKDTKGAECQKSCHTLDMECYSTQCTSGCMCPDNLIYDGKGNCISEDDCPCIHNEATYTSGAEITVGCNTCICRNRRWQCTQKACLGTCVVYGDGHYQTFDGKKYDFSGSCEYTLVQDQSGLSKVNSNFRVITENVPCGTTGSTCSKNIKVFLGGIELLLNDEKIEVVQRARSNHNQYEIQQRGLYLVIRAENGPIIMWDKKTSIMIKLSPEFQGKVCGLCGNYDGNSNNDFTTRSQSVVENKYEFVNSWKLSPNCPDVVTNKDPCLINPYRKSWSQKQCGIITSNVFQPCHSQVDPVKYYEACLSDSCACDSGGDCECFCTAVALYAQACNEAGVCIRWRTPHMCPLFCDYYNTAGYCEWHYKPCGSRCMKTCKNPEGICEYDLPGCEGCYPNCPAAKPYFDEDSLKCVAACGCYDGEGNFYKQGEALLPLQNCYVCLCTRKGIICAYDITACQCEYNNKIYNYMDIIEQSNNEGEECKQIRCDANGTVLHVNTECSKYTTQKTTTNENWNLSVPFTTETFKTKPNPTQLTSITTERLFTTKQFSSTSYSTTTASEITPAETTSKPNTLAITTSDSPPECLPKCYWTVWFDENHPSSLNEGDREGFEISSQKGKRVCQSKMHLKNVECRAQNYTEVRLENLNQVVHCDISSGLRCMNQDNRDPFSVCLNYEIRFLCCDDYSNCPTTTTRITTQGPSETSTLITQSPTVKIYSSTSYPTTTASETTPEEATIEPTALPITSLMSPTATTITTQGPSDTSTILTQSPTVKIYSSTSYPTTTASITTSMSDSTPGCLPQCYWTVWFDENHPSSRNEGDKESFEISSQKGKKVCQSKMHLKNVECRAQNYPEVAMENLNQVVHCDIFSGLRCMNQNNRGPFSMCLNYEIRFLCCDDYSNCPITTTRITTPGPLDTSTLITQSPTLKLFSSTSYPTTTVSETTPEETTSEPTTLSITTLMSPTATTRITTQGPSDTSTILTQSPTVKIYSSTSSPTTTASETTPEKTTGEPTTLPITTLMSPTATTIITTQGPADTSTILTQSPTVKIYSSTSYQTTTASEITAEKITGEPTTLSTTTSMSDSTPGCLPQCYWTVWFDENHPSSRNEGDRESFEISSQKGKKVCQSKMHLKNVECRAQNYPEVAMENLNQVVHCDIFSGLRCMNQNNRGPLSMCLNYEIRFLCCDDYSNCPITTTRITTPGPLDTSTLITQSPTLKLFSSTSYPTTTVSETTPEETTSEPTTLPITTLMSPTATTRITTQGPSDTSTILTQSPTVKIYSSTSSPTTTASETTPEKTTGEPTTLPITTLMSPTATTIITTQGPADTSTILTQFTTVKIYSSTSYPTTTASETTSEKTTGEPTTLSTTTSMSDSTPGCLPQCYWTVWFDENHPSSGNEGDRESFEISSQKGKKVCQSKMHLKNVECRAQNYPEVAMENLNQVVHCDIFSGLRCMNQNNRGPFSMCLNYEIRFLCCDDYSNCPIITTRITTPGPLDTSTLITQSQTLKLFSSTLYPTTTVSKTTPEETTSEPTTLPITTLMSPTATTRITTQGPSDTSTILTQSPTVKIYSSTSSPTTTASETTPEKTTGEPTTLSPTTSMSDSTPGCLPQCYWTMWFDENHPSSRNEGDRESFEISSQKGKKVCQSKMHLKNVECRAQNYPEVAMENLNQVVHCDIFSGLRCMNQNNRGPFSMCLNYEIRFLCCDDYSNCPTTTTRITTPGPLDTSTLITQSPTLKLFSSTSYPTTTFFETTPEETTSEPTTLPITTLMSPTATTRITTQGPSHTSTILTQSPTVKIYSSTSYPTTTASETTPEEATGEPTILSITTLMSPTATTIITTQGHSDTSTILTQSPTIKIYSSTSYPTTTASETTPEETTSEPTTLPITTLMSNTPLELVSTPQGPLETSSITAQSSTVNQYSSTSYLSTTAPETTLAKTNSKPTALPITHLYSTSISTLSISEESTTNVDNGNIITPQSTTYRVDPLKRCTCNWTEWFIESSLFSNSGGDLDIYDVFKAKGKTICFNKTSAKNVECTVKNNINVSFSHSEKHYQCNVTTDLICSDNKQNCLFILKIRFLCCHDDVCDPSTSTTTSSSRSTVSDSYSFSSRYPLSAEVPSTTFVTDTSELETSTTAAEVPSTTFVTDTSELETSTTGLLIMYSTLDIGNNEIKDLEQYAVLRGLCLYNGSTYPVGSPVPAPKSCQVCKCTRDTNPITGLKIIKCKDVVCQKTCQPGFVYQKKNTECCGTCRQMFCVLNYTGEIVFIKPGDLWNPPDNNCTLYECSKNRFTVTRQVMSCPKQQRTKCYKGVLVEVESPDKCCKMKVCIRECKIKTQEKTIQYGDCLAVVPLPYCEGLCNTYSRFSTSSRKMEYECSCCEATKIRTREIQLPCNNGTSMGYTYSHIDECQCQKRVCVPQK